MISVKGTVNGVGGYTFTATVISGALNRFGNVICKLGGNTYYSDGPKIMSDGY
jgi:hypothetical protein